MHTFKTRPDGFQHIKRKRIYRDLPLFLLTFFLGILIISFGKPERPMNWYVIGSIIVVLTLIMCFVVVRTMTTDRHKFEDFILTIDENEITREEYESNSLTIATHEVSKIYKQLSGGIVIKGAPGTDPIIIPPHMEEPEKLELELVRIKSFSEMPFEEKYWLLIGATLLGLLAVVYLASNIWLIGISGFTLLGIYGYSMYNSYKYKTLSDIPKSKIFFSFYIVFIIIRTMYSRINGG